MKAKGDTKRQVKKLPIKRAFHKTADKFSVLAYQQLLSIFDNIDEVVYVSDSNTHEILYVNKAIKKLFGNVIGQKCYHAFQGLNSQCSFCTNKFIFGENLGKSYIWEFQNRNNKRWYRCIDKAIRWPDGRMVRYEMAIDITDRKLAEERLRESEEKYHDLYDNAPDMYHSLDKNGIIIDCNETEARLLGYKKEEIIGRPLTDFFTEKSKKLFEEQFPTLNKERVHLTLEREFVRKDGTVFPASLNVYSEFNEKGELVKTRTIARDITIQKLAEDAIKESEEKYRALFENTKDAIYITTVEGKFVDVNPSALELFGYTREELSAMNARELYVNPDDRERFKEEIKHKGYLKDFEVRFRKKDGAEIICLLSSTIRHAKDGNIIGYHGVIRDITEKRKMEEELLKIEKLESTGILAGGIAHDFNNILTGILGNISIAKMYVKPGDDLYDRLIETEKASMHAKDLTQQLLIFSKGGVPIKKTMLIGKLIKDSANFSLRGSNVKCVSAIPHDLWPVEFDEGQISQVINNLIINADHAMPQGGIINLRCENVTVSLGDALPLQEGKYIRISIEDNGIGIPKKHLSIIFDPYFTTKQKGSGLGLAVAYSIIKKHNGYITVESKMGVGTTFHIYLPVSSKPIFKDETEAGKTFVGQGRILLMDDEEIIRETTGAMLTTLGYEIEIARDGNEAIEIYKKFLRSDKPFDAVILDLTVPAGPGGKDVIEKLREIDPAIQAIVSSGYSDDPVMANYREYGFDAVIAKPYKLADLSKILHELITNRL